MAKRPGRSSQSRRPLAKLTPESPNESELRPARVAMDQIRAREAARRIDVTGRTTDIKERLIR